MAEKEATLVSAIADIREEEAMALLEQCLAEGIPPLRLLELSRQAMDVVSRRYENGEYFLPELVLVGDLLTEIAHRVKPLLSQSRRQPGDAANMTVLIGTVAGDLHDIGKNIVTLMLDVNGFQVIDLGIDVPAQKFVAAIREHKPGVVGLSGFLTLSFDVMRDTIEAIKKAGLRDQVKIMIGGGQVDEAVRAYAGADAYGLNAMAAVSLCQGWLGKTA